MGVGVKREKHAGVLHLGVEQTMSVKERGHRKAPLACYEVMCAAKPLDSVY